MSHLLMPIFTLYQKYALALSVFIQIGLNLLLLSGYGPIVIIFNGDTFVGTAFSVFIFSSFIARTLASILVQKTL